ncbi:MAG: hypothetical protein JKY65_10370 [Planctomycetes bacterium]|nr:hypothetical protein [Planctomycetota bacterium]
MSDSEQPAGDAEAGLPAAEEPAPIAAPPAPDLEASKRRGRHAKLGAYGVFCLGTATLLLLLQNSCSPVGTIRGEVVAGQPVKVALVDVSRDVYREGVVDGTSYRVALPRFTSKPRVFVYGEGKPEHWVESEVLTVAEGKQEAPPLALWSSPLEIVIRDRKARFDWSPIPEGPGYPGRRRYSLLLRFDRTDGEKGEATLICDKPKRSIEIEELRGLLMEFDPAKPEVVIELRAYDPGQQEGALWVGHRRKWIVPEVQ